MTNDTPSAAKATEQRGALREAVSALELAQSKLPYGPRFDHAASRIGAALIRARAALNPAPPEDAE